MLRSKFLTPEQLEALTTDHRQAGLEPREVAMLDLVEKVVDHAYKVTPEDIEGLRSHGFDDGDIVDIVLAAAARCYMSKVMDALGATSAAPPDADPVLRRITAFER